MFIGDFLKKSLMEECICVAFKYKMEEACNELRVCYKWHSVKRHKVVQHHLNDADIFRSGWESWEDCHHSGCVSRLLTDGKNQSSECVPFTIWEMAEITRTSVGSCFTVLTENLVMCCTSAAEHLHRPTDTNWTDRERMTLN